MKPTKPTVFVVDDDAGVRKAIGLLMKSVGLHAETFPGAREFLDSYDPDRPGCLVLDVRLAGTSGLDLLEGLPERRITLPVIIITGHGDAPTAVRAIHGGAVAFIEKPFRDQDLLDHINRAMEHDAEYRRHRAHRAEVAARFARLTPRERQTLDLLVAGKSSKQIALGLGISITTVNIHRNRIMTKLQADSVVDLVRLVQALESDADEDRSLA